MLPSPSLDQSGARDLVTPGEVAMVGADDPFRLTIMGDGTRTVDSPARGNGTPPPPPPAPLAPVSMPVAITNATVEDLASEQTVIETPFTSEPTDLLGDHASLLPRRRSDSIRVVLRL